MFLASLAIIAVCSTGIVLALRDWTPRPQPETTPETP